MGVFTSETHQAMTLWFLYLIIFIFYNRGNMWLKKSYFNVKLTTIGWGWDKIIVEKQINNKIVFCVIYNS